MRAAVAVTLALLVGSAGGGGTSQAGAATSEGVPALGHVFLIIGENTTYTHLKPSNAPYLLGTVRPRSAWLSNYYAATATPINR